MPESSESERKKQEIILRLPLLQTFLDSDLAQTYQERWTEEVSHHMVMIMPMIKEGVGYDWYRRTAFYVGNAFESLELFQRPGPEDDLFEDSGIEVYGTLIGMGFELGASEYVDLFLNQIVQQLNRVGMINSDLPKDDVTRGFLEKSIRGIMEIGVDLRMESKLSPDDLAL